MPIHDTIVLAKTIHDTLYIKGAEAYELVNKVDAFYRSGWSNLLAFVGAMTAVIGIIVPLLLQHYQDKRFKNEVKHVTATVRQQFEKRINEEITGLNKIIEEWQRAADLNNYILESQILFTHKDYARSCRIQLKGLTKYLDIIQVSQIGAGLHNIKECISLMTIDQFAELFGKEKQNRLIDFLASVQRKDTGNLLKNKIDELLDIFNTKLREAGE